MMPDSSFRDAILGIVKALDSRPAGGLKGLAIVCRVIRFPCSDEGELTMCRAHRWSMTRC